MTNRLAELALAFLIGYSLVVVYQMMVLWQ
jgi:hypothetical protein